MVNPENVRRSSHPGSRNPQNRAVRGARSGRFARRSGIRRQTRYPATRDPASPGKEIVETVGRTYPRSLILNREEFAIQRDRTFFRRRAADCDGVSCTHRIVTDFTHGPREPAPDQLVVVDLDRDALPSLSCLQRENFAHRDTVGRASRPTPHQATIFSALLQNDPEITLLRRLAGRSDCIASIRLKLRSHRENPHRNAYVLLNPQIVLGVRVASETYGSHLSGT